MDDGNGGSESMSLLDSNSRRARAPRSGLHGRVASHKFPTQPSSSRVRRTQMPRAAFPPQLDAPRSLSLCHCLLAALAVVRVGSAAHVRAHSSVSKVLKNLQPILRLLRTREIVGAVVNVVVGHARDTLALDVA